MKNKKRKIKVVDVNEVIPERSLPPQRYDGSCIEITEENEKARTSYWPVSKKTTLENIDDAHFKSLKEALE